MLRKSLAGFVALVLLGLSALFTFGQKIDENLPDWNDVYEFFGMAEEIEKGEVYDQPFTMSSSRCSWIPVNRGTTASSRTN